MYFRKYKLLVIGQFNFELFLHSMVCICSLLLYLDGLLSPVLRPGSKINSLQCDTETQIKMIIQKQFALGKAKSLFDGSAIFSPNISSTHLCIKY